MPPWGPWLYSIRIDCCTGDVLVCDSGNGARKKDRYLICGHFCDGGVGGRKDRD